ncbi:MAG: hypothetical protein ACUVR7_12995 [Armatimonadota bacterium]
MKRLKGIDVPVFEARVDRDIRLVFTVQGSTEYDGGNSVHIRDRIVVWDVDHHDDALDRARCLSYDRLHALEPCSVACLLSEDGVLEEMDVSALPEYPFVPVDVVEKAVKRGTSVLRQYVNRHYRGEEWWFEQATAAERESLYDAQQFHERYRDMLERWKMGAVPKSRRDFRKRHAQFPWDEETLWGEYWDTIKGQLNWRTESLLDKEGYIRDAATEFNAEEREAIWEVISTWFEFEGQDELDLCRQLWEECDSLPREYAGVYVDEVQDLCEVEWMLLAQMVRHSGGLFFTGDPYQALRPSGFHWNRLRLRLGRQLQVQEGSLSLNLRNTWQIAEFVQGELERIRAKYHLEQQPDYRVIALIGGLPPALGHIRHIDAS